MTAKRFLLALGVVALILLIDGCAAPVTSGTVTAKSYEAAEQDWDKACTQYNGTKCVTYVQVPDHDPECFELELLAADGRTGSVCVPQNTWDTTPIGSTYPR